MISIYAFLFPMQISLRAIQSSWCGIEHSFLFRSLPCYGLDSLLLNPNTEFLGFECHNSGVITE
jgi:hypothetical protein